MESDFLWSSLPINLELAVDELVTQSDKLMVRRREYKYKQYLYTLVYLDVIYGWINNLIIKG